MPLRHQWPDCTGYWDLCSQGKLWCCARCGATVHRRDALVRAAIQGNVLGWMLHDLEQEGRRLLGQDGRPWTT
jgi:hypothetical protein